MFRHLLAIVRFSSVEFMVLLYILCAHVMERSLHRTYGPTIYIVRARDGEISTQNLWSYYIYCARTWWRDLYTELVVLLYILCAHVMERSLHRTYGRTIYIVRARDGEISTSGIYCVICNFYVGNAVVCFGFSLDRVWWLVFKPRTSWPWSWRLYSPIQMTQRHIHRIFQSSVSNVVVVL